jgi:hypothetical protein
VAYPVGSYAHDKRAQSRHNARTVRRPFAGIDGEGGNRDGRHHYFYLRAGARELYNENRLPLTTRQCLEFIADLSPDYNYVGFFFDYDVTMILRDLTHERVGKLLHPKRFVDKRGCEVVLGVDWHEFQITYRPGKEFKVRRKLAQGYTAWVTINDVGSFFQCTFVKALETWLGAWDPQSDSYVIQDERDAAIVEQIAEGKRQRSEFKELTEYVREYCMLECQQLAKLMERFRENCSSVGLHPTRWQGPGYLVSAAMRRNGFPKNKEYRDLVPTRVWELAQAAYYGGRFEPPIIGHIPGPVYQYDINSAYAGVYQHLPCLIHGVWKRQPSALNKYASCSIVHIRFSHKRSQSICAFPVRDKKGGIFFPRKGQGTYWWHEVAATQGRANVDVDEAWSYESHCKCTPFDWIDALYKERMKVGKRTGMGGVLKLVLASTYGKLCQSIGTAPYSNPIWASLITSFVRTQLYKAAIAENNGQDVIMLATDGLFTRTPRSLPISKEIGEWEVDVHDSMFVIQSGLYFLPHKQPKTRGVPRANIEKQRNAIIDSWDAFLPTLRWSTHLDPPTCLVHVNQFISLTQGYAWGDMSRAGQWHKDHERTLSFDWRGKRTLGKQPHLDGGALYTEPFTSKHDEENFPYKKSIGGIVIDEGEAKSISDLNEGQPDWNTFTLQ